MNRNHNHTGKIPDKQENPFRVPENYFGELPGNVMERIRSESPESEEPQPAGKKISMRPFVALAASISGIALVVYILLQTVIGSRLNEQAVYDIEMLENYGILQNERILNEAYNEAEESEYSEWEEDAMLYLSSNETDLIYLIDSN